MTVSLNPRLCSTLLVVCAAVATGTGCNAQSADREPLAWSYAGLIERLSEDGGYFDTDNLISNETSYLHVMGGLKRHRVTGGAYIGVGPDQNFAYIAAIRPSVAFIVDIRRDNMLEHLIFKAVFRLSGTRAEYLAYLLGLPAPTGLARETLIDTLIARFDLMDPTEQSATAARHKVDSVIALFGVPLTDADRATIDRFHRTFITHGLGLRFQSFGRAPQPYYPTLRALILERDLDGRQTGYLATHAAWRAVKELQDADRIIPVTGDFAGPHALRAIASVLEQLNEPVSAFYVSNVEYYLMRDGTFDAFVDNAGALPRTPRTVVIRSVFRGPFGRRHPSAQPGYASMQLLQRLDDLVTGHATGRYRSYWELVSRDVLN